MLHTHATQTCCHINNVSTARLGEGSWAEGGVENVSLVHCLCAVHVNALLKHVSFFVVFVVKHYFPLNNEKKLQTIEPNNCQRAHATRVAYTPKHAFVNRSNTHTHTCDEIALTFRIRETVGTRVRHERVIRGSRLQYACKQFCFRTGSMNFAHAGAVASAPRACGCVCARAGAHAAPQTNNNFVVPVRQSSAALCCTLLCMRLRMRSVLVHIFMHTNEINNMQLCMRIASSAHIESHIRT